MRLSCLVRRSLLFGRVVRLVVLVLFRLSWVVSLLLVILRRMRIVMRLCVLGRILGRLLLSLSRRGLLRVICGVRLLRCRLLIVRGIMILVVRLMLLSLILFIRVRRLMLVVS